jgi:ADP-dependent NAD(P)H-hydrate dehydratase / NAD(P)H-hydrate epimerase
VADEKLLGAETAVSLHQSAADYDAILIGPGLAEATEFVTAFFTDPPPLPPLVIDADGLNQLAALDDWPTRVPPHSILTPHPGEMARLMGLPLAELKQQNRIELAQQQAQAWQQIVILKGAYTVVGTPDGVAAPDGRCTVIPFANPALGTAGSGDVLAGVLVSLLGQGVDRHETACTERAEVACTERAEVAVLGCYLHALAGSLTDYDSGVLAREIANELPTARQQLINFERDA